MFQFMRKNEKEKDKKIPSLQPPLNSTTSSAVISSSSTTTHTNTKDLKSSLGKKVKEKLSPEDLTRLDEIRRSFKLGRGKKEKLPSGIIADYSDNFLYNSESTTNSALDGNDNNFSVSHSESSLTSISNVNTTLKEIPGPAKPRRIVQQQPPKKSPPPIPSRKPPTPSKRHSSVDINSQTSYNNSPCPEIPPRPPTSASSSSFTPTYITPPVSPSHNVVALSKFYPIPELEFSDKTLPQIKLKNGFVRTVLIERKHSGFGFSLRRASINIKNGGQDFVLYAEPSQKLSDISQLLPGDRLIKVNSIPVDAKNRDEAVNIIKTSTESVTLQVISNPIWIENINGIAYQKVDEKTNGMANGNSNRADVWVVHKNGFIGGHVLEKVEESGKCKVKLDTGQIFEVDENDIENTNPEGLDAIPGMWNLNLINDSSILHILRNRFHSNLPFTLSTNNNLLYLTKHAKLDSENYQYLKSTSTQPFTSSQLCPNIYSLAFQSYRALMTNQRNQSIIIHGQEEFSTKSECIREILKYYSEGKNCKIEKQPLNSPIKSIPFSDKLVQIVNLVEFFGFSYNTKYQKGTVLYNLEFDLGGRLSGINTQVFTLDIERLYEYPYFNIIQSIHDLASCPIDLLGPFPHLKQLRKDLLVEESDTNSAIKSTIPFFCSEITKSSNPEENFVKIEKISESMLDLGLGETFIKSSWSIMGACYHLGRVIGIINSARKQGSSESFKNIDGWDRNLRLICALLGLSAERVEKYIVFEDTDVSKIRNLMGFSLGLFFETQNSIFSTLNKIHSIGLKNIQCLSINVVQIGSSAECKAKFGDLSANYMNERVLKLIHELNFTKPNALYKQEGLEADSSIEGKGSPTKIKEVFKIETEESNMYEVLPLLDSYPSSTNPGKNSDQKKGLFFLIDEAKDAKDPARLLEKFESEFYGEMDYKNLYCCDFRTTVLELSHSNGTRIAAYDIKSIIGFTEISSASKFTNLLLQESQKDNVNCMFLKSSSPIIGLCLSSNATEISLRRASSIRRNYATTWKKKNASLNVKIQVDYLMEILERTQVQFMHCLNPSLKTNLHDLDMAFLRNQIRSVKLADCIRSFKNGYPRNCPTSQFVRKFKILSSSSTNPQIHGIAVREQIKDIFNQLDIPFNSFQVGNSMVFMKNWVLEELEQKRDVKLDPVIVSLQSFCRRHLVQRKLEKMKIRDVAIRCIQKNVRKLLAIKSWGWWKIYQKIAPLTRVQSSHEQLQSTFDELASTKIKLEKAEAERIRLKTENEKLEFRVNELTAELTDEQTTSVMTSEKLDQESNEKNKFEQQYLSLKSHCDKLEKEKHQLELDLAYSIVEINGNGENGSEDYTEDLHKQRWERSNRELEIQKQRFKQKEQDHLDQLMSLKKSLEKKCSDAYEEAEEQRSVVAQLKRRLQKLGSELSDMRFMFQEESSKCALLEKKQRRFDSEIANINSQFEKEKANKERISRERDAALIQKETIYNDLQSLKMELTMKESKLSSLEAELEEASSLGGSPEQINQLRKAKNDLQLKIKEQDEELDDLAGQVQMLEGAKLRLEMLMEQTKKENKREIQQREEEIEDVRNSAHKKVKALECQLEAEHEERTTILRAKQELERKLFDYEELVMNRGTHDQVIKLKRELKRTKALLKDSQTMLEQSKNDALSKGMLRQLRHQLEDSEAQRTRLTRAKQKLEEELGDSLLQLDELARAKNEAENMKNSLMREKSNIVLQFEENEEQLAEVMKKYKAAVDQLSQDQNAITEQSIQISELEVANINLKETISELNAKLESLEGDQLSLQVQKRYQMKVKELETRIELESTTKSRLEGQLSRLKEHMDKLQEDMKNLRTKEFTAQDKAKKLERSVRESKEEILRLSQKDVETQAKRSNLEKQLESSDMELSTLKHDLKLAMQRIEDLTAAIKECEEMSDEDDEFDDSTESVESDFDPSDNPLQLTRKNSNLPDISSTGQPSSIRVQLSPNESLA